ncbi:MAG TPA: patatin-like phospholipase family protein [Thermoanaerobaculia bacterium]|nr:patatin-like phospholipase family protein [Thermoanaerobaculia bacterium]
MENARYLKGVEPLAFLRSARRVGFVFSGGSARCAFQAGAVETLFELGVRPAVCVAVSAGVWGAAAVAVGAQGRLRHYWRAFVRMPRFDLRNLVRGSHTPFAFAETHRRTFERYVGSERLRAPGTLPLFVELTRLRDRRPVFFDALTFDDPVRLLIAASYLPPFYTHAPRIDGERYADGALIDNLPYEEAFAQGCDAVVLLTMKGESEGGLFKGPRDSQHVLPRPFRDRTVVLRPRHRLPIGFSEKRWPVIAGIMEVGRLRAREVLLGESHPETELRARGRAPTTLLGSLLRRRQPICAD